MQARCAPRVVESTPGPAPLSYTTSIALSPFLLVYFCVVSVDNKTEYGESYLRQCESIQHAQNVIATAFEIHGTNNVVHDVVNCDYDGSYGVNNIQGKQYVREKTSMMKILRKLSP